MITEDTVLILGAGASIPYGFPSGGEVKRLCCGMDPASHPELSKLAGSKAILDEFREALLYSGRQSVDEFLERRPGLVKVGKLAIAEALIPNEDTLRLFEWNKRREDWYQYIFGKMSTSLEEFDQNRISFITFNYDRSLEHFFFTSLKNSYDIKDSLAAKKVNNLPIIHLHGQLGYLPWQKGAQPDNIRAYDARLGGGASYTAAQSIKIIHESIDNDEEFRQAHNLLHHAKKMYFLGFGFHETNLTRLKIDQLKPKAESQINRDMLPCNAGGTAIDITDLEKRDIQKRTQDKIYWKNLKDQHIVEFLRKNVRLR